MSRIEVKNRNALTDLLLDLGYNVYLPVLDEGIDLIAHHEASRDTRLIQLKSRWTIAEKYRNRNIWIAFPDGRDWFLLPHDEMIEWPEVAGYTATESWTRGGYSTAHLSRALRQRCRSFQLTAEAKSSPQRGD